MFSVIVCAGEKLLKHLLGGLFRYFVGGQDPAHGGAVLDCEIGKDVRMRYTDRVEVAEEM